MQEALVGSGLGSLRVRIIPADAGSTEAAGVGPDELENHPRGCGEHGTSGKDSGSRVGSSPRMRGAQLIAISPVQVLGIIPADAGSTGEARKTLGI